MEITEFKLKYETVDELNNNLPVIIVAAGSSTRMEGAKKQFLSIGGTPIIAKTLQKFEESKVISRIILVAKSEDILTMQNICEEYNIKKISDIVEGGKTRNESVVKGMEKLSANEPKVLIHDGARPFVSQRIIEECANSLKTSDAVLAAIKATDTVKMTDGEETVINTLCRDNLYLAQTPQGVDVKKYLQTINNSKTDFTDDVGVMEYGGYKTVIVNGSRFNIKITVPEDIKIAEAYAKIEEEEE
ncbi:MAG: 2-C-methyl-D-erythritol 4-phosphate cytidylyltransferase [Clostridia bacterium]|nr:2-C-methyl-D-erythritol 4-phosphate cytidylyltransferase [Clostridia bacterium]